jgi:uncharacterized protein (TIGR03118 family)
MNRGTMAALAAGLALLAAGTDGRADQFYRQTNLVTSDQDPDLVNPWGISFGPTSPFWVSDNATGKATLYDTAGSKLGLVVTMPSGGEPITGQVFNSSANFNQDAFLFASESGMISGWRGALGTQAETLFSVNDAVYKGLAISTAGDQLFAANFHSNAIDVFDASHTGPIGSFTDPDLPAGYAPFNIQNIGGTFYVTFAKQDADAHDDVPGVGHGVVDIFNPANDTFTRLITGSDAGGTVDALDSPWGVALAPASFGPFGGALLVGNFGDGVINAFDPVTGALLGRLRDGHGDPIVNPGLWGLTFGNGGNGGLPGSLYITAGGAREDRGLFARIDAVPEPGSLLLVGLGGAALVLRRRRRAG